MDCLYKFYYSNTIQKYLGLIRDLHDDRDYMILFETERLPNKVDLRSQSPYIFDQGSAPSCTANAVAIIFDWIQDRGYKNDANAKKFIPSRLFLYYNTRKADGNNHLKLTGSSIRNCILSAVNIGVCSEELWPYDIKKYKTEPVSLAYLNAKKNLATKFARVDISEYQIKLCLKQGNPIVFGLMIYENWFFDPKIRQTGYIPPPKATDKPVGGHAMVLVGYDDVTKTFIVQNSWGPKWGEKGFCYIPYEYVLNRKIAWDFWVIKNTSKPDLSYKIINPKDLQK